VWLEEVGELHAADQHQRLPAPQRATYSGNQDDYPDGRQYKTGWALAPFPEVVVLLYQAAKCG
jgi:hypothetical protein